VPTRRFESWNKFVGPVTSISAGAGLLYDFASFAQDQESKDQVGTQPTLGRLRDARFLLDGKFNLERKVTWCVGIMYDDPNHAWLFRQTGLMIAVPEIDSHFFVGRAK